MDRNRARRPGTERCPCGSRRLAKRCCRRPPGSSGGVNALITLGLPGLQGPGGFEEGIVEVTPERQAELEAAFAAAGSKGPGDDCPICVLQRRWAQEDGRPSPRHH